MSKEDAKTDRRSFLTNAASVGMAGGLVAGYGMFGYVGGRYLYPAKDRPLRWMYVARVADFAEGGAMEYVGPSGEAIAVARTAAGDAADAFIALSSTCPHLGCKVFWEAQNDRFFCPCHNGVFTPEGVATGGPPAKAGQSLARYPLRVDNGLLYIQVPVDTVAADDACDGHDPCLRPKHQRRSG